MEKEQLGQHFLINKKVLKTIVEFSELNKNDVVLEIGAGNGVLTRELAEKVKKVAAIELDDDFKEDLDNLDDNVQVIIGDALGKIDMITFNKIVANIPYVITEPLFRRLLKLEFDLCVLLIGENFYNLLNENGKWGVISKIFFDVEKILDVKKEDFNPKPRTNSVLIRVKKRNKKLNENEMIVKEFSLQDDKKVRNALIYALIRVKNLTKKKAKELLSNLDIKDLEEENTGSLSNEDFMKILGKINNFG